MSFTNENEKQNRMPFLNVKIVRLDKTFTISVYRKPIFSGVYIDFESFLPSTYKISKDLTSGVVHSAMSPIMVNVLILECKNWWTYRYITTY